MKKNLLFCFLIITAGIGTQLFSQNANIARHSKRDAVSSLVNINSKCFYLERIYNDILDSASLVGINSSGQIIFKKSFMFYDFNSLVKLIKTKDKALVLIGTSTSCDLPGSAPETNFMIKVDTNGVVLFQTNVQFKYGTALDKLVDITQHADSSYYLVSDSLLYHYSKTGAFISKINSGLKTISAVLALSNGNLLTCGKLNNTLKKIEMTTAAVIVNQQNAGFAITRFIQSTSGNLYALTTARVIEKLGNTLLSSNSTSNTVAGNIALSAFTTKNDSVFAVGNNTVVNTPAYFLLDQNLSVLYQSPASTYEKIYPSGIVLDNNNRVNIIANSYSSASSLVSFESYFRFPVNGTFASKADVGVTSFSVIAASLSSQFFPFNSSYYIYPNYNLNVTVKNFTSDTVKSFCLNYDGVALVLCGRVIFHKFYNTTILPNGSVVVQTGNVSGAPFYVYQNDIDSNDVFYSPKMCLFTTIPNASNDIQVNNDASCDSIPLTLAISGIKNNFNKDGLLKIFPNPFNDHLNFEAKEAITKIEIYNVTGALVDEGMINNRTTSLNLAALPAGMYLLKIETEKGISIKKVVKN